MTHSVGWKASYIQPHPNTLKAVVCKYFRLEQSQVKHLGLAFSLDYLEVTKCIDWGDSLPEKGPPISLK